MFKTKKELPQEIKIGDKVQTNSMYMSEGTMFKKTPLKSGIVTKIEVIDNHRIIYTKSSSGKERAYNELFLWVI